MIPWTNSLVSTHVFFLGYPDGGGTTTQGIAGISQGLSVSDDAGIGTYADSGRLVQPGLQRRLPLSPAWRARFVHGGESAERHQRC